MGGRTFQVGSVSWDIFSIFFFFLVVKMTPLKTQNYPPPPKKKIDYFLEKNFRQIFSVTFLKIL